MLLEIITVILALHGAEEIDHITTTPYADYRKYDYGSYGLRESIYDNSEDPSTNKNTERKLTIKTLSPEEIEEVKRAIHEMLPGHEESLFTQLQELRRASPSPLPYNPYYQHHTLHTRYSNESGNVFSKTPKSFIKRSKVHPYYPFYEMYTPQEIWEAISFEPGTFHTPITIEKFTETTQDYYDSSSLQTSDVTEDSVVVEKREADDEGAVISSTEEVPGEDPVKGDDEPINRTGDESREDNKMEPTEGDAEETLKPSAAETEDEVTKLTGDTGDASTPSNTGEDEEEPNKEPGMEDEEPGKGETDALMETSTKRPEIKTQTTAKGEPTTTALVSSTDQDLSTITTLTKVADDTDVAIKTSQSKATTTRTYRSTTTKFQLDVPMLLQIIANLTYDYEMNLTENLNETLLKLSIPTCGTPTTTVKPGAFIDYEANATGTIVAKCFVCGLTEEQVPRHAQCADAFAGDFLPLVPVDMTARGRISKYRKYCRYLDVPHYLVNSSMPRSVYGRWSGGCSVRWIDLSGIYTQRSCRNRERPVMGRHAASKRMAKLELALNNMDDGCIVSPMATLVPLSRGISLYARFHACVCTGSWCNTAADHHRRLAALVPVLLVYVNALTLSMKIT